MKASHQLAVATALATALFVALLAIVAGMLFADLSLDERQTLTQLLTPHASLLVALLVMAAAAVAGIARLVFLGWVQGSARLAEEAQLLHQRDSGRRLADQGPTPLRSLVRSLNAFADERLALREDVEARIAAAKHSVEEEKNRLAALMAELSQSVVVCNLDGRILLYNQRARQQFRDLSGQAGVTGGGELIGLGRSIYGVFERNLITHALDSLQLRRERGENSPVANFVTTTRAGLLLRLQMTPVLAATPAEAAGGMNGFILILDNITRQFEQESRRDQMIHILTEGNRAALANVRAAAEMLDFADLPEELRKRFRNVIRDEVEAMGSRLNQAAEEFAGALKARWPLEEMLAKDLVEAAQRRIETTLNLPTKQEDVLAELWVKVDSFSLLQALTYLASRLADEFEVREVRFRAASAGRLVHLDLIWSGAAMSTETVMNWELEPMHIGTERSPLTVRDVIERHDGEIWLEREKVRHRAFFRIVLPAAAAEHPVRLEAVPAEASRPEYYDFDLFSWSDKSLALQDRQLAELDYTIFDTETTGLQPSAGDEIIQVGAVRIVNGRLLQHETFEQLIDPRRELPAASTRIHGITPEMLEGAPTMDKVLPAFHAFCTETVLVAHNAAFDMRFLQLKEEATGIRFDQPVLDTLLLSAIVHPNQESHRLEAIAERLGVKISGRHTALGDALVTAEVFLRLLPLLAEQGITTLGQAREAAEKSYYARVRY